jgi:hypothetical protein
LAGQEPGVARSPASINAFSAPDFRVKLVKNPEDQFAIGIIRSGKVGDGFAAESWDMRDIRSALYAPSELRDVFERSSFAISDGSLHERLPEDLPYLSHRATSIVVDWRGLFSHETKNAIARKTIAMITKLRIAFK